MSEGESPNTAISEPLAKAEHTSSNAANTNAMTEPVSGAINVTSDTDSTMLE